MRDYFSQVDELRYYFDDVPMVMEAADAIEELVVAVPKWISVEGRLPKPFVDVLVKYNHGDELSIDCVDKNGRWQMLDTSHWMPLPSVEGLNGT